jgi:cobalt-zinc-cadmium efflux system outer membrane protein
MRRLVLLSLCAALGCASTRPDAARRRVDELARERLDRELAWTPSTTTDARVEKLVDDLLARPLTAESAVQIALVRNPRMQATLEELGVAQADLVQAGLLRNPHFGGGPRFPSGGSPVGWEGDAAIAFLDALMIPLRRKLAKARLNQAILGVAHGVLELDAEVRTTFYEHVAAAGSFEIQRDITELAEAANELATRQLAAGTLNQLDAGTIAARYQDAKLELAQLQDEMLESREHLNRALGLWGGELRWTVEPELPKLPAKEPAVDRLEVLAVANRLDLEARRVEITAMRHAVAVARRSPFIAADLGVLGERDPGDSPTFGPFIELEVPIFDWGRADVARAEAELRMSQRHLQQLAIMVRSEVREKRNHMIVERRKTEYEREVAIDQRRKNVALALERYNAMLLGVYDLLERKQEEYAAKRELVEHLRDYWIARTELELAIGGRLEPLLARSARAGTRGGK